MFASPLRLNQINLTLGAYRNEQGVPEVLPSVRMAEADIERKHYNHEYLNQDGLEEFNPLAQKLMFSEGSRVVLEKRVFTCQSISGTGSLRLALDFMKANFPPDSVVYIPSVTWGNHPAMVQAAGLKQAKYAYLDEAGTGLDFAGMMRDISQCPPGSIILLHAIAHNPTGVDPTESEWDLLRAVMKERQLFPFFDNAYQAFVTGNPDTDAYAVRSFAENGMDMIVACSFAKNFGLYGERVGCVHVVVPDPALVENVGSQLRVASRVLYSTCPTYGARIVATILGDEVMNAQWRKDCMAMSTRLNNVRQALYEKLLELNVKGTWSHVIKQRGMFTYSGIPKDAVTRLREEFHIYMLVDGRISLAGLNGGNVDRFCAALLTVLGSN
jgi:aspartate/tyrosine/aromatic aminotransferase